MPIFRYKGYRDGGTQAEGILEADSRSDAVLKLKARGIFPKEVTESVSRKRFTLFRPSPHTLADMTRRLATLHTSGVPLIEAFSALSSEQKGQWKTILVDIKDALASGSSLARALQGHPGIFPEFYTGMIAAGESSGRLDEVLTKLADYLETEVSVKSRVRTALIYPAFMACVSIVILFFLFTFVIPRITRIFEDTSTALPMITVILIWISAFFRKFWWLAILLFLGAVRLIGKAREKNREIFDRLILLEPTGTVMSLCMLRFSLTLGFLLSGGLPMLRSLQLTAKAVGNAHLDRIITEAESRVSQGASLSGSLEGFPPTLLQILSTGEQTGRLPELLQKSAASYEEEFDRRLQRFIGMLEPSLILLMGLIVGFIVVAVLLPIFELNQIMQ
jgi:general secretion pathway protein F